MNKVKDRLLLKDRVRESKGDYGAVSEAKMNSLIKRKQFVSHEPSRLRRQEAKDRNDEYSIS